MMLSRPKLYSNMPSTYREDENYNGTYNDETENSLEDKVGKSIVRKPS